MGLIIAILCGILTATMIPVVVVGIHERRKIKNYERSLQDVRK